MKTSKEIINHPDFKEAIASFIKEKEITTWGQLDNGALLRHLLEELGLLVYSEPDKNETDEKKIEALAKSKKAERLQVLELCYAMSNASAFGQALVKAELIKSSAKDLANKYE